MYREQHVPRAVTLAVVANPTKKKTRHAQTYNTRKSVRRTLSFLLLDPIVAVEVKPSVPTANRNNSKAAVGSEVGRGVDVQEEEKKPGAKPHREPSVLHEPLLRVLRHRQRVSRAEG